MTCNNNNLTELPELPERIDTLECMYNNIKYLSLHNINIIKMMDPDFIELLHNPFSNGFETMEDFLANI